MLPARLPRPAAPPRGRERLATLGSRRLLSFFATTLLKHELTRGARAGRPRPRHRQPPRATRAACWTRWATRDVAVRSWAADGLSRLGDARALPVLTGNLRHEHLPIRLGAILSFAALGPEGDGGMLARPGGQRPRGAGDGLRHRPRARPARLRAGASRPTCSPAPSPAAGPRCATPPPARWSCAPSRRRTAAHLVEVLQPPRPEKAGDMKDWPAEDERASRMVGLAEALASDAARAALRRGPGAAAAQQAAGLLPRGRRRSRGRARSKRRGSRRRPRAPRTRSAPTLEKQGKASAAGKSWLRRLFSAVKPPARPPSRERRRDAMPPPSGSTCAGWRSAPTWACCARCPRATTRATASAATPWTGW